LNAVDEDDKHDTLSCGALIVATLVAKHAVQGTSQEK
jgi:hypothetical protein